MKYTMSRKGKTITLDTETGMITGNTYDMKDVIKEEFPGATWDKVSKAWHADGMAARIEDIKAYLTRCYNLTEVSEATAPTTAREAVIRRANNGICPRCGTYCYGDCSFR